MASLEKCDTQGSQCMRPCQLSTALYLCNNALAVTYWMLKRDSSDPSHQPHRSWILSPAV